MISIYNHTDRERSTTVHGTQVVLPPYGAVQVSRRKADAVLARFPGEVSTSPHPMYTDADIEVMRGLNKNSLQAFAESLMRGQTPDVQTYARSQQSGTEESTSQRRTADTETKEADTEANDAA